LSWFEDNHDLREKGHELMIEGLKLRLKQATQAHLSGEAAEAERLFKEAAAEAKAKDDVMRAEALMGVAQARRDQGDRIGAAINYAEAITSLRAANATQQLAYALRHAADIRSELKEFAVVGSHIEEAIRLYRAFDPPSPLDLANALRVSALNDEREARASWNETRNLYTTLHITAGTEECDQHLEHLKQQNPASKNLQEPAA
jgi:tetratricopeptide (TPR) repeat protein